MDRRLKIAVFGFFVVSILAGFAGPVIDPIPVASIPAGKSLTIPITATSTNGRPLTYTVTSSTNRITVELHTNNPFWKLSVVQVAASNAPGAYLTPFRGGLAMVTNVGDMTLLLLRDRAPKTVEVFQGLSMSGYFNSNTIFHRVIPNFMIQGGDPATNGSGGPTFRFDDEFHPRSIFSGSGQLAMANSGKDTAGSQFFITQVPYRSLDFGYTIFGQLLRGYDVLTNIINTPRNSTNGTDRPFRDVIITRASFVTNFTDTAITLTGTNLAGVAATIRVIADDGVGGRVTNSFAATTVADANTNSPPFIYPDTVTNLVAAVNTRLTNWFSAADLEGAPRYFFPFFYDYDSYLNASNTVHQSVSNYLRLTLIPATNFSGPLNLDVFVSSDPNWNIYYLQLPNNPELWPPYDYQFYQFAIGDTAINANAVSFSARESVPFTNVVLATFTNGVPNSSATNFTAYINWGDNTSSTASVQNGPLGVKQVVSGHTYTNSGIYPVQMTIRSQIGAVARTVSTVTVSPYLTYRRTGNTNILRWPAWAGEFLPQTHTNLSTADWVTLTNLPTLVGYENMLTNSSSAPHVLFRLRR